MRAIGSRPDKRHRAVPDGRTGWGGVARAAGTSDFAVASAPSSAIYSILLAHEGRSLLVLGSAGFVKDALRGRHADVVFLGIGTLGKQDDRYRDAYWRETVAMVGARRIIPIHWDDFSLPLDQPLQPFPLLLDDFDRSMRFLLQRGQQTGVDVQLASTWMQVDPFADLARAPAK